jgi:Leucine-rich repeat (LRR) protein
MTTEANKVDITIAGIGKGTADWGDGKSGPLAISGLPGVFLHYYSGSSRSHTVTITGSKIITLDCSNMKLTALDVSKNTTLKNLDCSYNKMSVEALNALFETLHSNTVQGGQKEIDFSGNPGAGGCNKSIATSKGWKIKNEVKISMTTVSDEMKLNMSGTGTAKVNWGDWKSHTVTLNEDIKSVENTYFDRARNYSHTVTISGENIRKLLCSNMKLTALDVSNNTALVTLYCNDNQLTVLEVGKNTALIYFWCLNNQLTALDVSKNTAITHLGCNNNQLTVLDVSKNTALKHLNCSNNKLSVEALNALFETLHSNTVEGKEIDFSGNPGAGGCNRSIATNKGWKIKN